MWDLRFYLSNKLSGNVMLLVNQPYCITRVCGSFLLVAYAIFSLVFMAFGEFHNWIEPLSFTTGLSNKRNE